MEKNNIYIARCPKSKQLFVIETSSLSGRDVINFDIMPDEYASQINAKQYERGLTVSSSLRSCRWCGSRSVGDCSCRENYGQCPSKGVYNYQCLFCSKLEPVRIGAGDVRDLRLSVTSPQYDNIGPLLEKMGLRTHPFSATGFDCDVLFINCGTADPIDPAKLRKFVREGGCAYISDLAICHLNAAFGNAVVTTNNGKAGTYPAKIVDPELKSVIGNNISVVYDLGVWAVIQQHRGDCLIQGSGVDMTKPMMVSFVEGDGKVFYTSFHNHSQASEAELAVLKLMLLRQISEVCHQSIGDVAEILGLNITSIGTTAQNRQWR